MSDTVENFY